MAVRGEHGEAGQQEGLPANQRGALGSRDPTPRSHWSPALCSQLQRVERHVVRAQAAGEQLLLQLRAVGRVRTILTCDVSLQWWKI